MAMRTFDVVLFGATGFTGRLTAAELLDRTPDPERLALAGRNLDKLAAARDDLARDRPQAAALQLVRADATDQATLRAMAQQARVVATTVGPYVHHGEGLVAACAAAGTDYVDLTGEPEFVDRMYTANHHAAVASGARLVHACGFDSIPHDLGVLHCVNQLPEGVPLTLRGYVRAGGRPSGGTFHSAITAFSRVRQTQAAHRARRAAERAEATEDGRRVRLDAAPHRTGAMWAVPLPTIDPQVIATSARRLPRYGPDFTYGHFAAVKRLPIALGGVAGVSALFAAAQLPPARRLLLSRLQPGDGPTDAQREKGWFSVRVVGEGGGRRAVTEVRGGDPGYTETARMLAESALCLAHDPLPATAGQVTTAQAMGTALIDRLQQVGITFEALPAA